MVLFEEWIWLGFNFYQCSLCILILICSGQRVQTTFQKIDLLFMTVISTSDSCNSIIYQDCNKCSGAIYMCRDQQKSYIYIHARGLTRLECNASVKLHAAHFFVSFFSFCVASSSYLVRLKMRPNIYEFVF